MRMNSKQIVELNELLVTHSETLTAFYDEGIKYGMNRGLVIGVIGNVVGIAIVRGVQKLYRAKRKKETKEES